MTATYNNLLDEWREAAAKTRQAQQDLKDKFDQFLQGSGPEPSKAEIDQVQALREVENAKLEAAMAHVRDAARRP